MKSHHQIFFWSKYAKFVNISKKISFNHWFLVKIEGLTIYIPSSLVVMIEGIKLEILLFLMILAIIYGVTLIILGVFCVLFFLLFVKDIFCSIIIIIKWEISQNIKLKKNMMKSNILKKKLIYYMSVGKYKYLNCKLIIGVFHDSIWFQRLLILLNIIIISWPIIYS